MLTTTNLEKSSSVYVCSCSIHIKYKHLKMIKRNVYQLPHEADRQILPPQKTRYAWIDHQSCKSDKACHHRFPRLGSFCLKSGWWHTWGGHHVWWSGTWRTRNCLTAAAAAKKRRTWIFNYQFSWWNFVLLGYNNNPCCLLFWHK